MRQRQVDDDDETLPIQVFETHPAWTVPPGEAEACSTEVKTTLSPSQFYTRTCSNMCMIVAFVNPMMRTYAMLPLSAAFSIRTLLPPT